MSDVIERLRGLAQNPYPHGRAGQFGQTFVERFAQSLAQQAQANQLAQMEERKAAAQAGHGMVEIPSWFAERVREKRGIDLPQRVDARIFQMFTPLFADEKPVEPKTLEESLKLGADFERATAPYTDIARNIAAMNSAWEQYKDRPESSMSLARAMMTQLEHILNPNSRLRDTVIATTVEGQALIDHLTRKLQQLRSGGGPLTRAALEDILSVANTLARAAMTEYDSQRETQEQVVQRYGLDRDIVIGPDPFRALRNTRIPISPATHPTGEAQKKQKLKVGQYTIEEVK